MVRTLTITSDDDRRVLSSDVDPGRYMGCLIDLDDESGVFAPGFKLYGDVIVVDRGMLLAAAPVWEAFVTDLSEIGAQAKIRYNLDLACEALGLPEQPLAEGQALRACDPAGTVLYISIGCSILAGITQHP